MVVRIKDIARMVGCSEATVSLALNNSNLVKQETKELILKTADEVGYIPNVSARALVKMKSGCIGLVIPDIENVYYASLVKYINQATHDQGYELTIALSDNQAQSEEKAISTMIRNRVEGVIFVPMNLPNQDAAYLRRLQRYSIPYVFCSDYYRGEKDGVPVIMADLEQGMYDLVTRVAQRGYRHISYLTGDDRVVSLELRTKGFRRAAEENGLSYHISRLPRMDYNSARAAVQEILQTQPETEAFVCVNDMSAIAAVNVLSEMGLRVPEDKGVAGFDNVIFSRISSPGIHTVKQDLEQIAAESVATLLDGCREDVIVPMQFIERGSLK